MAKAVTEFRDGEAAGLVLCAFGDIEKETTEALVALMASSNLEAAVESGDRDLEQGWLARIDDGRIAVDHPLLDIGHEFADGPADTVIGKARLPSKSLVDLQESVIQRPSRRVADKLGKKEASLHAGKQAAPACLAGADQLLGILLDGDVARDRQQTLRLPFGVEDRRNLHIPPPEISRHGVGEALEMARAPGLGGSDSLPSLDVTLILPEIGPGTVLDRVEVADFHHAHPAFAHEGEPRVEVQDLDAIGRGGQDAAHELGVVVLLLARETLFRADPAGS